MPSTSPLKDAKRVVLKIGSALLVEAEEGRIRLPWLYSVAEDIHRLTAAGVEVLVVSSGAIAAGRRRLGLSLGHLKLEEKQAAAATGQIRLAHAWEEALGYYGLGVAQILLTLEDTEARRRYLNARQTLETLLSLGAVPIINENDTVATEEIRFGDNDRLAARVAAMVGADLLILLSDIDGLYDSNPQLNPDATFIPVVTRIDEAIRAMGGEGTSKGFGTGGMVTKIMAAEIATAAGCEMIIAQGHAPSPLRRISAGERHTLFEASTSPQGARKRFIQGGLRSAGAVTVDDGALRALARGKSLLFPGVLKVEGDFERGDGITLLDRGGREIGRGLAAYPSQEAAALIGKRSEDIEALIGYRGPDELIHRSDLALAPWVAPTLGEQATAGATDNT